MESSPRNCIRSSEKYWLYNIGDIVSNINIFPAEHMSLDAKLNSLMRLSLIIFSILMLVGYRFSILFLLLTTIINIIFYFMYKNKYD